jgi:Ca2+/Na+ antiporter
MFKETLRVFAMFLMMIIIIMDDFPFYSKLRNQSTQLFLGIFVICTIYYDLVLGFIMALVMMLIYYEIYKKVKVTKVTKVTSKKNDIVGIEHYTKQEEYQPHHQHPQQPVIEDKEIQMPEHKDKEYQHPPTFVGHSPKISTKNGIMQLNYISDEHLLAAQNNIFDSQNFATEVKGIEK